MSKKPKHPPGCCPECGSKDAECVIGNFWVCKTKGCPNGPEQPSNKNNLAPNSTPRVKEYSLDNGSTGWRLGSHPLNIPPTHTGYKIPVKAPTPHTVPDPLFGSDLDNLWDDEPTK